MCENDDCVRDTVHHLVLHRHFVSSYHVSNGNDVSHTFILLQSIDVLSCNNVSAPVNFSLKKCFLLFSINIFFIWSVGVNKTIQQISVNRDGGMVVIVSSVFVGPIKFQQCQYSITFVLSGHTLICVWK